MLYTRQQAQENLRNWEGKRIFYLGKGDQLTSDARDWLTRERIPILPADQAKQERYALENGGYMEGKPEHMTHLNAQVLVPKDHPRIAFRGAVDSLEANLLWCQLECPHLQKELGEILTLARNLLRWEVLEEPAKQEKLLGLTMEELRSCSHRPQDYFGIPHFMPEVSDGRVILALNAVRTAARAAELAAVRALPQRTDILQAMNRMSSGIYILMLKEKANAQTGI